MYWRACQQGKPAALRADHERFERYRHAP